MSGCRMAACCCGGRGRERGLLLSDLQVLLDGGDERLGLLDGCACVVSCDCVRVVVRGSLVRVKCLSKRAMLRRINGAGLGELATERADDGGVPGEREFAWNIA